MSNVEAVSAESPGRMSYTDVFKSRVDLMKAFCETARTYVQISAAALALPIVFTQAVLGKETAEKGIRVLGVPASLTWSWICFLLAVGFGLLYQWLAIRLVRDDLNRAQRTEENVAEPGFRITWWIPQFRWLNRSILYGGMVVCFYAGAVLFVVFAAGRLGW